ATAVAGGATTAGNLLPASWCAGTSRRQPPYTRHGPAVREQGGPCMDDAERDARHKKREAWAADTLARQASVMDDLGARAIDTLGWLAVRRQAGSYLRHLG